MSKFHDKKEHMFLERFMDLLEEDFESNNDFNWISIYKVFTCIFLALLMLFLFIFGIWGLVEMDYAIRKGDNVSDCSTYSSNMEDVSLNE